MAYTWFGSTLNAVHQNKYKYKLLLIFTVITILWGMSEYSTASLLLYNFGCQI